MKRLHIFQPLLFSISPILSLYGSNVGLVAFGDIARPAVAIACMTLLSLAAAVLISRDSQGSVIVVSTFWFLFFSYEPLLHATGRSTAHRSICMSVACCLLLALAAYEVRKRRYYVKHAAKILAAVGFALIAVPLVSIVLNRAGGRSTSPPALQSEPLASAEQCSAPDTVPDIYYIILDTYARADILRELYGYDNTPFLHRLSERGFYVADRSSANYSQTWLSLASSLNATYLDRLATDIGEDSRSRRPLINAIGQALIINLLRESGYKYIAITSGFELGAFETADRRLSWPWSPSMFEEQLVAMTPIAEFSGFQYDIHRQRVLFAIERLAHVAEEESPKLVVAHIASPHPPFVLGASGESTRPDRPYALAQASYYQGNRAGRDEYVDFYCKQLAFVSTSVEAAIDAIIAGSAHPPVIVLQSDHGPESVFVWNSPTDIGLKERMSILNAYYLPNTEPGVLYESITPVNTFRVIFNQYFGTDCRLLDDRVEFSTWDQPYHFIDVTDRLALDAHQ